MADDDVTVRISLRDDMSRGVRQIDQDVRRLIIDVNVLGRTNLNGVTGSTMSYGRALSAVHSEVLGLATAVTNPLMNGLRLAGIGFAGASVAAAGFGIKALSAFDQTQTALNTLTGSLSSGHALMAQLQQYDLSTAFDFSQISAAAQTLEQFNVSGAQTVPVLKALGDVAALTTDPSGNLSRMALAIGQISSSGVLRGQDLNQLIQAGFPSYALAASASGMDPKALRQQMESGGITLPAGDFLNALTSYQGPIARYKGAAVKQGSQSPGGAISNMASSVQQAGVRTALPYKDQLAGDIRGITSGLVGIVTGAGPEFFHMLTTLADFLVKELPHAEPVLTAVFHGVDQLVTQAGPVVDKLLGPLAGDMGHQIDEMFAQLVPVMPDLVQAFINLVMVLPEFLLLLAQMIQMSQPIVHFVDDLLSMEGGRKVVAALLVTLLGYRALSTIVGPIVATTAALRGLAGAGAIAGAGGGAAGAAGLAGAAGTAGVGLAGGVAGSAGFAAGFSGKGTGIALSNPLTMLPAAEGWLAKRVFQPSADGAPNLYDRIQAKLTGGSTVNVSVGQGAIVVNGQGRDGGQEAARGFMEQIQQYANERALRR